MSRQFTSSFNEKLNPWLHSIYETKPISAKTDFITVTNKISRGTTKRVESRRDRNHETIRVSKNCNLQFDWLYFLSTVIKRLFECAAVHLSPLSGATDIQKILDAHYKQIHEYNEIKDVGQMLLGKVSFYKNQINTMIMRIVQITLYHV